MLRYGKKKRPMGPNPFLHNSTQASRSPQRSGIGMATTIGSSSFDNSTTGMQHQLPLIPSPNEVVQAEVTDMVEALLETSEEVSSEGMDTMSSMAGLTLDEDKPLPASPKFKFNGDNTWAVVKDTIVSSASSDNHVHFGSDGHVDPSPNKAHLAPGATSSPLIPRKSSQRDLRARKSLPKAQHSLPAPTASTVQGYRHQECLLKKTSDLTSSSTMTGVEIQKKIDQQLKSNDEWAQKKGKGVEKAQSHLLTGPLVPNRGKANSVLGRFKTFVKDRRSRHDITDDELLLDSNLSSILDAESEDEIGGFKPATPHNATEMEESHLVGENTRKREKVHWLSGKEKRKPVADANNYVKFRKSTHGAFSKSTGVGGIARSQTTSYLSHSVTSKSTKIIHSRARGTTSGVLRKNGGGSFDDEDALMSSSPTGQSTPRVCIETTEDENGRREQRVVPVHSPSPFLQPHNIDVNNAASRSRTSCLAHNKASLSLPAHSHNPSSMDLESSNLGTVSASCVAGELSADDSRQKEHPSPSMEDLDRWQSRLRYLQSRQMIFDTYGVQGLRTDPRNPPLSFEEKYYDEKFWADTAKSAPHFKRPRSARQLEGPSLRRAFETQPDLTFFSNNNTVIPPWFDPEDGSKDNPKSEPKGEPEDETDELQTNSASHNMGLGRVFQPDSSAD